MRTTMGRITFLFTSAFLLTGMQLPDPARAPAYAAQGWTEPQRNFWYQTTQGSRLMPLAWMQALEVANGETMFLSDGNIERFRYLTYTTPTGSRLPVGFAIDRHDDSRLQRTRLRWLAGQGNAEPWIGFTCSACHTGEIAVGQRRLRIDGAPALGHYQRFVVELDLALAATRADPAKWRRFASRVLGAAAGNAQADQRLRQAVDQLIAWQDQIRRMNAIPFDYGFARVDAFGHIFNKAVAFASTGSPAGNPSSAPVSYPFLWNITQHDRVQWNGSVANKPITVAGQRFDIGAVGRNTGEVIGVFGEVVTRERRHPGIGLPRAFESSVNFTNLIALEGMLERLQPPLWPEPLLGRIDRAAAARGEAIFMDRCASCHVPLARDDLSTRIVADMAYLRAGAPARRDGSPNVPPGTDPVMACNAYSYGADTGRLQGYMMLRTRDRLGSRAPVIQMLSVTAINSMFDRWASIGWNAVEIFAGLDNDPGHGPLTPAARAASAAGTRAAPPDYPGLPAAYRTCIDTVWQGDQDLILGYKARPLTGIWATAPYLHNGSVASLYQLLLPPARRLDSFFLGTRQYDARNVGYQVAQSAENSFEFRSRDASGHVIWGNFNGGHDYDNAWFDGENERRRFDLIEYLKTL